MDTHSALPLYLQLSEMLARDIAAGHLLDGERLPPEREMAAKMGTSVGTLRKALAELTERGLLERRQGSGNYVRRRPDAQNVYAFFRIELLAGGGLPTARLLSLDRMVKPAALPDFGSSDHAHRIRRLRALNGRPCVLEEIWLDAGYADRIAARDLSESLYLYYRTRLNLWIAHVEDHVSIGSVPDWAPDDFAPRPGATTGFFQRLSFDRDNRSAEFSHNWFDPDIAHYVTRLR
ncbi:GntR family transcriptional regulator [Paracoccus sediminicola]|uniref:GntR family transcriptional regulator n=1 Tax=Paracoccus sediminicola TaxID=3017783 RepID=UPI0022F022C6|nr:GntR family transcriptional regulator [Paracoccus sediminicola]WBU57852.1 GntR family transcriptional regulator [Paracoccus sediminicola]